MKILKLALENIRGFENSDPLDFSESLNVILGQNNSGKSTIIRSLYCLQSPSALTHTDIRAKKETGKVLLRTDEHKRNSISILKVDPESDLDFDFKVELTRTAIQKMKRQGNWKAFGGFSNAEPNNQFYPFLSKRKVDSYALSVDRPSTITVSDNLAFLTAKVDRILTAPRDPMHNFFRKMCKDVLGFEISTVATDGGKKVGLVIDTFENITLDMMGDGVPQILGLIASLCIAEEKIFVIEEPETDLHPTALKGLLKLIVQKSISNQFFVTTHSNIVAKYLGSESGARVFKVSADLTQSIPNSTIKEVSNSPMDRHEVLEELGYDFHDFELFKGWLILEESSAETVIRDFLIPWYFPGLNRRLRTISVGGISKIESYFDDFTRLFLFLHREPMYRNKAWVWVDGDEPGKAIVTKLKTSYKNSSWKEDTFSALKNGNFEDYYPARFSKQVNEIKSTKDAQVKRNKKEALIKTVNAWALSDPKTAQKEFRASAKEIIEKLSVINGNLKS